MPKHSDVSTLFSPVATTQHAMPAPYSNEPMFFATTRSRHEGAAPIYSLFTDLTTPLSNLQRYSQEAMSGPTIPNLDTKFKEEMEQLISMMEALDLGYTLPKLSDAHGDSSVERNTVSTQTTLHDTSSYDGVDHRMLNHVTVTVFRAGSTYHIYFRRWPYE